MRSVFLALVLVSFLSLAQFAYAINGLVSITAEPINEGENLDVYVRCKEADANIVTITLYGENDEELYSIGVSCSLGAVTFTNLSAGVYKIKATMSSNCDPCMLFKYVNVKPSFWFFVPEGSFLTPLIGFIVLFIVRSQRKRKGH
ncbi:MAG: hypothetical protein J7L44_00665 [Candidatus Diapherotrites archaeon]|nr:hypothetical protein [Candidatus Diapherotrites archaeon]